MYVDPDELKEGVEQADREERERSEDQTPGPTREADDTTQSDAGLSEGTGATPEEAGSSPTPDADSKLESPPTGQEARSGSVPDDQDAQEPDVGSTA